MTAAPDEPLTLARPDDEVDLFADERTGPVVALCWFCDPADQPEVPDGAEYTFDTCRRCRKGAVQYPG